MSWPLELGGRGLSRLTATLVEEVFGYHWLPLSSYLLSYKTIGAAIERFAAAELVRAPAAADRPRRARLLPGLLGAGSGERPRRADDEGGAPRRHLRRHRPQDLDLERAARRLDLPRRPHRRRGQAPWHLGARVPGRHARDRGANVPDARRRDSLRDVPRRRRDPGREPRRRGERRLGRADVHARLRACHGGEDRRRRVGARRGRGAAARRRTVSTARRATACFACEASSRRLGCCRSAPPTCSTGACRAARPRRWRSSRARD